jgi:hypothetical protein
MQAIGRAEKMHGASSEKPLVERPRYDAGSDSRTATLAERVQALHHYVEIIAR